MGITLRVIFENSLKSARAFRQTQFQQFFKYHEWFKSLIVVAFIRFLIYNMNEKITKAGAFRFALQCNLIIHKRQFYQSNNAKYKGIRL